MWSSVSRVGLGAMGWSVNCDEADPGFLESVCMSKGIADFISFSLNIPWK